MVPRGRVFVTGYGMASVETRYTDIPLLQKPLDRRTLRDLFDTLGKAGSPGGKVARL